MSLNFPLPAPSEAAEALRHEVREFLATALAGRSPAERAQSWSGFDPAFSRAIGARGWIGMTWPRRYGGAERSALERYVVLEEMLAAGAPVSAHWIAERQSGPLLLKFGTEQQRESILPRIARGECSFCIGLSEPDSGSDISAIRTRARRVEGGFAVTGTKIWTSKAHCANYMILFCRSDAPSEDRHAGFSQFLVDLARARVAIRPILAMNGEHHFNEVVFEDTFLPEDALVGSLGQGWRQVGSELAFERSGPERFLSSFTLLVELVRVLGELPPSERAAVAIGRLAAHIITLRRLSRSVAGLLQSGADMAMQAALVKDLGTALEQEIPEIARLLVDSGRASEALAGFQVVLGHTLLQAPSFSLRGGTTEMLRNMIARAVGLR
ncbi:MAG: acyl-CoA dehydrogenase family protein [Burkholderiaceae bacterium]|jgi:alkylation response protein AidB-like acyl-CoA dehydrogenase|nr:acyl-CoA dehydrogenase family protein [Gemmatimonadales bacterium]MCO5118751.1 acyl-CoA dehydrogenase family protein [Burkholderiaceae bacterium]MEB2319940.1 acyl-CoA dehydrogenase family protein [Pseudomonadota bacterium]